MPWRIYREWALYSTLEPFGEERADLRSAIIASTVANSIQALINSLAGKKRKPTFKPEDFMPKFEVPRPKTPDELYQKVQFLNWLHGGAFIDRRATDGS